MIEYSSPPFDWHTHAWGEHSSQVSVQYKVTADNVAGARVMTTNWTSIDTIHFITHLD